MAERQLRHRFFVGFPRRQVLGGQAGREKGAHVRAVPHLSGKPDELVAHSRDEREDRNLDQELLLGLYLTNSEQLQQRLPI